MSRLKSVSWRKFEKFLIYVGCYFVRQKGDHLIYWRSDLKRPIVIPKDKEIPIFIIKNNLKTLGISVKEYLKIMENL